ncbi:putative inositol 1-monophosphatase ImpA [Corynebacterium guangdongense]|uniref:Myo-inositol-1(Or 4)-monophosphatase n=2 Tax=Corynebacterium guangdongense TaxID=1783348 RepID=A0ABU1ZXM5_9CORY|nr:myo-inositol-1(or 4)-monophosphatase [Corynebacterium guangdongense]WJZ18242.1 putative inositol 1-monophosphatase ImpA [Corynebacterium guangdongense]
MRNLDDMLAHAVRVVEEAEAMFIAGLGSDPASLKFPGDFATEIDVEIESTVRRMLTQATDIPVFGEEAGGVYQPEATWIVDPIDGTSNYAAGNPLSAILVSLVLDDEPVVAVTSIPMLSRRLTAVKGRGVTVNGRRADPIRNRSPLVAQVGYSSVGAQYSSRFPTSMRLEVLARLSESALRPRITGSVGVDLALTAQGTFDGAVSFSPYMWDNSAGVLLVREAGGVVTDIAGDPWVPKSTGVVAGTEAAHREIMSTMNKILAKKDQGRN